MAALGPSDEPASRTGFPALRRARGAVCRRGAVAGSRRSPAGASTGFRGGIVPEAVALVAESVAEQIIRQAVPGVVVQSGMPLLILALEIRAEADIQVQLSIPSEVGSGQAGGGALGRHAQPQTPRKPGRDRSKRGSKCLQARQFHGSRRRFLAGGSCSPESGAALPGLGSRLECASPRGSAREAHLPATHCTTEDETGSPSQSA